jgi:poly(3-hydroxyalkanoate) synthetase
MRFGDKVADLRKVQSNLLAFAGTSDQIAPIEAARAIENAVGSKDKEFHVVHGGHMGVFAGSTAPHMVWEPAADWLAPRSQLSLEAAKASASAATRRRSASNRTVRRGVTPAKPQRAGKRAAGSAGKGDR